MVMSIQQQIRDDMKAAMIAKDSVKLTVVRGLLAAFTNEAVTKGYKPDQELSDEEAMAVIGRAVKQRKDSIEQFEKGGRPELAEDEKAELEVLMHYMPAQMSQEEVIEYVKTKQAELNYPKDKAGQLMGVIMKDLKGKTDGSVVKVAVDSLFA
jgi:uncharacterized protein YqeY